MILITSAAYINAGLISEFGKLPPCMLPVQNKRLYQHQLALLKGMEHIVLTLPQGFEPTDFDKKKLENENVKILYVPQNLQLGESIVYALNILACYHEPLRIFHGDTLFSELSEELDICSVAGVEDDYSWGYVNESNNRMAYAGYFTFSSQSLLIRSITECGYHFIAGVEAYHKKIPLKYIETSEWLDFGLVNAYYRSKSKLTTQRVFNGLEIDHYSVKKYSTDSRKILAEAAWFVSVPVELRRFIPALWDYGVKNDQGYYVIEYFYLSSLAELFVFGKNPLFIWKKILNACADFICRTSSLCPDSPESVALQNLKLYSNKTRERLKQYADKTGISLDKTWRCNGRSLPSLLEILKEIDSELDVPDARFACVMHGDFCFSNILYDFKTQSIRIIDPRGLDANGNQSIYGDMRYDVAKLAHSVLGMYDFIVGGNFILRENGDYDVTLEFVEDHVLCEVQSYFKDMHFAGFSLQELKIYPILVHLFLSMLPLHHDQPLRQRAMLANALRLYYKFKEQTI